MKSKLTIDEYGTKEWKLPSGKLHREDGPAYEGIDGLKSWWINGKRHREDGPAIEWGSGHKWWLINGIRYGPQEYKYKIRCIKLNKLLNHQKIIYPVS
jgi:hypothetical protein